MKNVFLLSLLLLTFSVSAQDWSKIDQIASQEAAMHRKMFQVPPKFTGQEYDLKYHRFNWKVDPAKDSIRGSVTSYFTAVQNNLSFVDFSLIPELIVDSVIYHGTHAMSIHVDDRVSITMPVPLPTGTLDSVTVYYHGKPVPAAGSFGSFITDSHNGSPVLWTLSEPYGAYEWWPCKNDLSDKIDSIDVYITYPNGNKAASNGLLVSTVTSGSWKTSHWRHRYPIAAYLIAIAVTNYSEYTENVVLSQGTLPILNYVYPENLTSAQSQTPDLWQVIQFYDTLIAPYPFMNEKYGHAQFSWGGGMEHQTMSYMVGFDYELMAHELSHQWYGDAVTCSSWHDIWLNEGFATYITALCYNFLQPAYWSSWKNGAIQYITSSPDGSVYVDDTTSVDRVFDGRLSYRKGAYVLHMLRWVVGDSAFFHGLRNYYNAHLYGYATTDDLISAMEASSGKQLDEFFADWFYGEGFPTYNVQVEWTGTQTKFVINQTQSHPSVSFFEMPLPIRCNINGHDTTIVLNNTQNNQTFLLDIGMPQSVSFDPDKWILSIGNQVSLGISIANNLQPAVYPNPVSDVLTISGLEAGAIYKTELINPEGKIVYNTMLSHQNNQLNVDKFASGIYTLRLVAGDKQHMINVVIK